MQRFCLRGHDTRKVGRRRDHACRECTREMVRERQRAVRREALLTYGDGSCAECGHRPGDLLQLELHHVNGDGREHRLALTGHAAATSTLLSKLRGLGWPNDPPLATLCRGCHQTKTTEEQQHA